MLCANAIDVFEIAGRETVFSVTRKYLERFEITGTEFVFTPDYHLDVQNSGTLYQEFTQRAAIAQNILTRRPMADRMREIMAIADAASKIIRERAALRVGSEVPSAKMLTAIAASDPTFGPIDCGIAMAIGLKTLGTWQKRWAFCLRLIQEPQNTVVLNLADQTLSEMLRLKPAVDWLFANLATAQAEVDACLALAGEKKAVLAQDPKGPIMMGAVSIQDQALPQFAIGVRARLTEILNGPQALAPNDPRHDWKSLRTLREHIQTLPSLGNDPQLLAQVQRRQSLLAAKAQIGAMLDSEKAISGKLTLALDLLADVEGEEAQSEVIAFLRHYIELPELRKNFAPGGESAKVADELINRIGTAKNLPQYRKQRFIETLQTNFKGKAKIERQFNRNAGGPFDMVEMAETKYKLLNWSPVGLLFGQCHFVEVGSKFDVTVLIRQPTLSINYEAECEAVRVVDGTVAVRYTFKSKLAEQKVKAYFS